MSIKITGGRLIDPANQIDRVADLYIVDDKIAGIDEAPAGFKADTTIDATGKVVCPGLVDLQARLREPGFEYKATIESETAAAAQAGITTLVCPPDTKPVVDTRAVVESIQERAKRVGKARVYTLGALTLGLEGKQISEMSSLRRAGCVGVSNALKPVTNTLVMRRAMEYAASCDLPVFLFAEDRWLRGEGLVHEGAIGVRMGLAGIPETAETIAVARDLALIEQTGVRAHFLYLSCKRSVRMVARAKHDGLPVSASVTAHHLHLTEMDLGDFNTNAFVRPPLRTQRDQLGLRRGLQEESITAICSDHQPHDADAKFGPLGETEPGISALQSFLPLGLRLVEQGVLSLSQVIACMSQQPAEILGLPVGRLDVGRPADVCVFDAENYWMLESENMLSMGKNSPFAGWEFKGGRVTHTLLDGKVVYTNE